MFQQTPLKRVLFSRTLALATVGVLSVISILAGSFTLRPQKVLAANSTSNTINFQARLQTNTGAIVPDGYYNVQFKLYDGDTLGGPAGKGAGFAGTNLWTETWYDSNGGTAGNDNRVRVQNGYLTVSLGSQTPFPSTINWDQGLWLTMNIGGTLQTATPSWDGEMNPRLQLTAVPYALRAGQLAQFNAATGYTSTLSILQPTGGNQLFQLADQGTAGTYTICVQNSAACGFAKADGTTSTYIQNKSASQQANSNFWISGTGRADTALQAPSFDTPTAVALNIGTTNATSVTLGKSGVNTFVGGNLSIGTTQSFGAITVANGAWITGVDASGTGSVNMFSVNGNNQIQVGAALNVDGGIVLPADSGPLTVMDESFSSGITAGTPNSYTFGIGQSNALTVYGENDGNGNAQNVRVGIGSSITPGYTLDVGGDINLSGGLYSGGGSPIITSGKVLQGVTTDASILTSGTVNSARISGSYTGITGVGTLTVGTWNASTIAAQYGGTGVNGASAANGQLLIGNGSGYTLATLTAGTGVSISNAAGSITINSSAVGAAGGDLSGSYPNPTVAKIQGTALNISGPTGGQILVWNGTGWTNTTASGDIAIDSTGAATIATGAVTSTKIADGTIADTDLSTGTFTHVTGTGALNAGSIASGFGTISTGNNITTTAALQGGSGAFGTALSGAAISSNFKVGGGSLGSTLGTDVNIASFGGTSTNADALGVHLYRESAGSDWTSSAIVISRDVDSTTRAGTYLTLGNGGSRYLGVDTLTPGYTLDVQGGNGVNSAQGFWVAGSQVITAGKVLQGVTANTSILTAGTLGVARGGTGLSTVTSHGVLYGNGTGNLGVTAAGTGGQVLLANGSGVPTFTSFSGDIAVASDGTTAIGTGKVTTTQILDGTVSGTDIANNTITNSDIASGDFANITGTGALNVGSIASGFGTISTGNTITTTSTVQGGTINATGSLQTAGTDRIDASGNLVNINDATINGVVTVTNFNSIKASLPANTVVTQDPTSLAQSPMAASEWHDLFAFNKYATPTYEQYNGTAWNSATLDSGLFAQQENRRTTIADGTNTTAARWTWYSTTFSYSYGTWLNIGFNYNNPSGAKTILFESSADGTTWTTRHTSTVSTNAAPAWFYVSSYGGDPYLRLTITSTVSGDAIGISSIRLMSDRWGDQGGGSELSYPYSWDGSQNITTGAALTTNGNLTVGGSGYLSVGGQQVITSGRILQGVTANASILTSGTIDSSLLTGSYTGITGVGTITTGTWNGTAISDTYVADNLTVSTSGNVAWTALSAYPTGCGTGQAVTSIGDTLTCSTFATTDTNTTYSAGNDLDLTGTTFSIEPQLDTVTTISRASSNLTLQTTTSGNIILNSAGTIELQDNTNVTGALSATGNINTSAGDIQIGGTSVITSTKVLQNVTTDASIINNGTGTLNVNRGGTGLQTVTSHGILYGNGTSALGVTAAGTSGQVLVANASGVPTFVTFTGDVTVSATGATAIGTGKVTSTMILDGTVSGTDIANNTITNSDIQSGAFSNITGTGALDSGSITSNFGAINNGASGITTTGTLSGGTLNTGGTQRIDGSGNLSNIGTYSGSGNITTTGGVLSVQGSGSNYLAGALGIGTQSPQGMLDVRGGLIASGFTITNPAGTYINQWTRLGECTISTQYHRCEAQIQLTSTNNGAAGTFAVANVDWRVKQQTALGGAPFVELYMANNNYITNNDVVAVVTQNDASATVVDLYLRPTASSLQYEFNPTMASSSNGNELSWFSNDGYTASLPAGTQTVSSYLNGNFVDGNFGGNLNVGGQTVITSAQVLQNVTASASILTSGTISSSLLTGSYTGITGVGTITTGTWNGTAISDTYVADNLTVSTSGNVAWTALSAYPTGCGAGQAVTAVGDTLTCSTFATTDTNTTYSAGNDLDLSGTTFNIEPQLDFVTTISRASSNLTLQTTTSGNIILNSAGTIELQDNTNVTGALGVTGNISTSTGDIQIGATSVITSTKVLQNVTTDASIINNGTGTLNVNRGGTGATSLTAGGILLGNGTGAVTATGVLSNGQLLIGDGTGAPTAATLSGGSGVSITNGAGSISIAVDSTVCRTTNNCSAVGTAGGDLTGSYPNPTIANLQGSTLTLTTPTGGNILQFNGTAWVNQAVSGDITISGTGVAAIGTGKVTSAMILDGTIANGDLANNAVNSAKIADGTVTGTDIANNTITNSDVASGAFSNITGTGALDSGSITSNFGAINNGNSGITTTGTLSGGTLSVGGTQRIDGSGNLSNIGNITASGNVQQTGSGATNYFLGALGLGTANPQAGSALTVANNSWITSVDASGSGYVNMFQVNAANQIQVGAALNVDGGIVLPTNGGQLTFADMGVDSNALNNTPESYSFRVGSTNALTVYGESDGTGNTKNVRVAIGSSITPGYTLDVGGDINLSGGLYSGGSQIITSGKVLQGVTANASILTSGTIGSSLVSGSYTGITGVGTLTVGTWNASTIGVAYGGTGLQTVTSHGLVYGNGTGNLGVTAAGTSGQVLIANGSGIPTFATFSGDISTVSATGQVTIANNSITTGKILDGTIGNGDLSNSAFGNIIGTGALASGSIVSGFGSISTGNNITTTATLQGGTVIATSAIQGPSLDTAAAGTLSIGTVHATTVNIATNAATHTIAIANGAAAQTVTIGSTNGSSSLTLQAGTSGIALNATNVAMSVSNGGVNLTSSNNSSTAFVIQSSTGAFLTADASQQRITTKDLYVGSAANVSLGTRLFADSFETGDLSSWVSPGGTGTADVSTSPVHNGKYSGILNTSANNAYIQATIAANTTVYGRTYFNVSTLGNPTVLMDFGTNVITQGTHLYISLGASGDLCYNSTLNTTVSACSTTAPSTGVWHELETQVVVNGASSSLQVYLDGTLVTGGINLPTTNFGTTALNNFALGNDTNSTAVVYFDDVAVDTVATGTSASAYVSDSLHVGGQASAGTISTVGTDGNGYGVNSFGSINTNSSYSVGGQTGLSSNCNNGQGLNDVVVSGGIIVGGSCGNAASTLQNAYDNTSVSTGGGSISTPALVQQGTTNNGSKTTSQTVTMPATTTAGNLLVAIVGTSNGTPTETVSGGGTWHLAAIGAGGNTEQREEVFYCYNCGATSSVTVNYSTGAFGNTMSVTEYSGVQTSSDPLEAAAGGAGAPSASATLSSPTITTTNANDLIVVSMSMYSGTQTASNPPGYTPLTTVSTAANKQTYSDYIASAAAGNYSAVWSISSGINNGGVATLAFKAARTGGGNNVASILLADAKDYVITAPDTSTDPNIIFNLQCRVGCSTSQGRWAIQSNGTDALSVLYDPSTAITNVRIQSGVDIKMAADSVGVPSAQSAITHDFTCTSTEQVNDIVAIKSSGTVGRTTAGPPDNSVIGVVVAKPSSTVCTVAVSGIVQVSSTGTINPGDLIQTSATGGVARGVTSTTNVGSVLGKALSASSGGLVWIVITM